MVFQSVSESQFEAKWNIGTPYSPESNSAPIDLAVAKVLGAMSTLDYEIVVQSPIEFTSINKDVSINQNSAVYYQRLFNFDEIIRLIIN